MNVNIKWGDTLSGLAQKFGTSVGAIVQANAGKIKDPNLIFAGDTLKIPGSSDGFDGSSGGARGPNLDGGASGARFADSGPGSVGPNGSPFDIARAQLGKNAGDLKLENSAVGRAMQDWVPNNINCANFVSGCLVAAGQIDQSQQSAGVYDLMGKLDADKNFQRTTLANAKPGDVVSFATPGGGEHVVMFAGFKNGQATFIGSNNVNADGSQRITEGPMNYTVMAVHHYVG